MTYLKEAGIGTGIHYPIPLHLQKAYVSLGYSPGDYPVAESASGEILSLPMYPQLTANQQSRVVKAVISFSGSLLGNAHDAETLTEQAKNLA
jgi:dTDP-4-amino-4,6-dideoxygalactose transaminase